MDIDLKTCLFLLAFIQNTLGCKTRTTYTTKDVNITESFHQTTDVGASTNNPVSETGTYKGTQENLATSKHVSKDLNNEHVTTFTTSSMIMTSVVTPENQSNEKVATNTRNMESSTRSLTLVLTSFILVVVLLLLISVIQRRKDRDLLLEILEKLDENPSGNHYGKRSDTPETNHSLISENDDTDRNYQEISHFPIHPIGTQLINCETKVIGKTNSPSVEPKKDNSMLMSMDFKSDQLLLHAADTSGVYDLQQRF